MCLKDRKLFIIWFIRYGLITPFWENNAEIIFIFEKISVFHILTFQMVGHHWALLIGSIELTWPFFISREKRHSSITHICARFFLPSGKKLKKKLCRYSYKRNVKWAIRSERALSKSIFILWRKSKRKNHGNSRCKNTRRMIVVP